MNILKTFKQYFKDSITSVLAPFTTDYSVYSPEYESNIDEVLLDIDNKVNSLMMFCQPKTVNLLDVSGWTITSTLECIVCGNTCYVNGVIGKTSGTISGEVNLPIFPDGIRPKNVVKQWYPIIVDGVEYKVHFEVRNNGNLNMFFYDTYPANTSIPLNFTFQMTTDYVG